MTNVAEDTTERVQIAYRYLREQDTVKNIACAKLAHYLVDSILAAVKPGMRESEVKALALQCFQKNGIERTWHTPYARFGSNTLLTFADKATEDRILQEDDIAFLDIGIVLDGYEGDAGRTVVFGENALYRQLSDASERIFREARQFWKQHDPAGIMLYEYIATLTESLGFTFSLDPAGHLIGEFPHRGWKKGINHFPGKIEAGKWVLEIQIRHPSEPYGAFYENLLY